MIKKKLDNTKGLWTKQLHKIIWLYHTTHHSTTGEAPFTLVYGVDAMLLVRIDTPIL